jgi:hypothetical protein
MMMYRREWSFDYRLRCLVGGMPSMGTEGQGEDSQVASYRGSLQVGPCAPKHGFMVWPCHPTDKAQCPSPSGASLRMAHPWAPFCMQSESGSQGQVSGYGNGCLHTASKSLLSSRPKRGNVALTTICSGLGDLMVRAEVPLVPPFFLFWGESICLATASVKRFLLTCKGFSPNMAIHRDIHTCELTNNRHTHQLP